VLREKRDEVVRYGKFAKNMPQLRQRCFIVKVKLFMKVASDNRQAVALNRFLEVAILFGFFGLRACLKV